MYVLSCPWNVYYLRRSDTHTSVSLFDSRSIHFDLRSLDRVRVWLAGDLQHGWQRAVGDERGGLAGEPHQGDLQQDGLEQGRRALQGPP